MADPIQLSGRTARQDIPVFLDTVEALGGYPEPPAAPAWLPEQDTLQNLAAWRRAQGEVGR